MNLSLDNWFGECYMMNGDFLEALNYYNKWLEKGQSRATEYSVWYASDRMGLLDDWNEKGGGRVFHETNRL